MFDSLTYPGIEILDDMYRNCINPPDHISFDGEIHRFGKKKSCWYVAHLHPVPVCVYGDWKQGITNKYVPNAASSLKPTDSMQVCKKIKAMEMKRLSDRERQYQESRFKAQDLWDGAKPAMFNEYLRRKQVLPLDIRVDTQNNLLVPVTDGEVIHSLQFIQPDGTKRFLKGGKTKGMFHQIKPVMEPEKLLICEGFATCATLYMETKLPVIVAFSARNLVPVAKAIRRQYPMAVILICGDNDHATKGNPGKRLAIEAARACQGHWIVPDFKDLSPAPKQTDFNDLYLIQREAACE